MGKKKKGSGAKEVQGAVSGTPVAEVLFMLGLTLEGRIKRVIDLYESGNVASAARKLEVSQRGLAKVCAGEVKNPGARLLQKICEVYKVDPYWLLLGHKPELWQERMTSADAGRMLTEVFSALAMATDPDSPHVVTPRYGGGLIRELAAQLHTLAERGRW